MPSESLLQFPCDFPIKVMGEARPEFETAVLSIIHRHVPDLKENAILARTSKEGKYLALTITIVARSQAQLDTIYRALTASQWVLMAL
jgi:uncharacterized protein